MVDTQPRERPILVALQENNRPTQTWSLHKDEMLIGREDGVDIQLPFRQVSRHHLRVTHAHGSFFVEDLESKNGTWVNGQALKGRRELRDGDEIHLALVARLQYVGTNATAPLPFEVPETVMGGGRLRLEHEARRVFVNNAEIDPPLSPPQYRLLELLHGNAGNICTREAVIDTVWPEALGEGVSEQAIDALVRRLRDRLAEVDPEHQYIVTVRGHGFRLDPG